MLATCFCRLQSILVSYIIVYGLRADFEDCTACIRSIVMFLAPALRVKLSLALRHSIRLVLKVPLIFFIFFNRASSFLYFLFLRLLLVIGSFVNWYFLYLSLDNLLKSLIDDRANLDLVPHWNWITYSQQNKVWMETYMKRWIPPGSVSYLEVRRADYYRSVSRFACAVEISSGRHRCPAWLVLAHYCPAWGLLKLWDAKAFGSIIGWISHYDCSIM